jgi:hypothetical protein
VFSSFFRQHEKKNKDKTSFKYKEMGDGLQMRKRQIRVFAPAWLLLSFPGSSMGRRVMKLADRSEGTVHSRWPVLTWLLPQMAANAAS